jgi:hypothetical protein
MNNLTEFQQRAAALTVVKMLQGKHFDICTLDALAKTLGRTASLAGVDYAALRGLHCVDYADMGPDLARLTREKALELLGLPPQTLDDVAPENHKERPSEPVKRLRLAFWK